MINACFFFLVYEADYEHVMIEVLYFRHFSSFMSIFIFFFAEMRTLQEEDLKRFRQWESSTPGHPENFETPGVEVTTGQNQVQKFPFSF